MAIEEINPPTQFNERLARIETAIATERPHLATKADVVELKALIEKQPRQFLMWLVGVGLVFSAVIVPLLLYISNRLPAS